MKSNGLHASTPGRKKVVAVSLILALVIAAISAIGVFAAPTPKSTAQREFGDQVRELNFARAWFNSARLDAANFARTSDPAKAQQYLSQYAFALRQADAIVAGHGMNTSNNNGNNNNSSGSSSSSSSSSNSSSTNNNNGSNNLPSASARQDLATWLHMMHGLRDKLAAIGFNANMANSGNNMAGSGVPVTGGTSSSSSSSGSSAATSTPSGSSSSSSSATSTPTATPTTSGSSSSSSSATSTPTATPTTSGSSSSSSGSSATATPTTSGSSSSSSSSSSAGVPVTGNSAANNAGAQHRELTKAWGAKLRDLDSLRAWFFKFKSDPANFINSSDPVKTQQWLGQFAFALRQADAVIAGHSMNTTNNNGSNSSSSNSSSNNNNGSNNQPSASAQQDLATWLHMLRQLQSKLVNGMNGTNNSSSSTTP